jgi:hypothetical protein
MAPQGCQYIARYEDLRHARDNRTEAQHLEHEGDFIAEDLDALLPPRNPGMMVMPVVLVVVVMVLFTHLAQ